MGRPFTDIAGNRYGRLTAVRLDYTKQGRSQVHQYWECVCDCGGTVTVRKKNLMYQQSCGCAQLDWAKSGNAKRTHGATGTPMYKVWMGIIQRCLDERNANYHKYGGRGITVCSRWRGAEGFANFLADMGERPSDKHQIDRINNNGGYEPSNCRWVTCKENNRNRRSNRLITANGVTKCLAAWSEDCGLPGGTIIARLNRGYTAEKAVAMAV